MKSLLTLALLLSATAPAFADHTRFVSAPAATATSATAPREFNRVRPYSRSYPRFATN